MPPYGGRATVEKVAINAVMAGAPAELLPFVLAASRPPATRSSRSRRRGDDDPAGPVVVVSGPYAPPPG